MRRLISLARKTGFSRVIDLSDLFLGVDPADLAIAPDDYHPNARGHALLANRLEAVVMEEVERISAQTAGLSMSSPNAASRAGVRP